MNIEDKDSIYELQNKKKKKIKKKMSFWNILGYIFLTFFVIILMGAASVFYVVKKIIDDTPPITNYDYRQLLAENSIILDSNGELIEKIQNNNIRTVVPYENIDNDIINAFVAVEDKTFFEHNGFNYVRLIGSVVEAISQGKSPSGTSTITQQYARNMYLTDTRFAKGQKGYVRKIKEGYYTILIEKHMEKKDILAAYLNTIELGANVKGIEAACQRYFSKSSSDVDYIEAAILAGIPKANSQYSPFLVKSKLKKLDTDIELGEYDDEYIIVFNEKCLKRYNVVLSVMKNLNVITQEQYDYAKNYNIVERLKPGHFRRDDISSYFTDMVKSEVVNKLVKINNLDREDAINLLNNGGLKIYTTLDTQLEKTLEKHYDTTHFNNIFDEGMRQAVISFQKKYKLSANGVINSKTLDKMSELGLIKRELFNDTYSKGATGEDIISLKNALEKNGVLFKRNSNMPAARCYRDVNKNILNIVEVDSKLSNYGILLYAYNNLIDENENLIISPNEYEILANNDLKLFKGKKLQFYDIKGENSRIDVLVKDAYISDKNFEKRVVGKTNLYNEVVNIYEYYVIKGRNVNIPDKYKKIDDSGNLIISSDYFNEKKDFYVIDTNKNLLISKDYYNMSSTPIIQPQSAMVIVDYRTGYLKAIVGGRNISGQMIYNRAINPRPPGSSIKPLAVYLPALDNGYTVATAVDDVPMKNGNKIWPKNWYASYKGIRNIRQAVEYSINTIPVKIIRDIGEEKSVEYLKKFGISTIVEKGNVNDLNPASLALGGMSKGITPFDMTGAYGSIANGGIRNETITFTKIIDRNGQVILENIPEKTYIADSKVAYLMLDILRTTVSNGIAKFAQLDSSNSAIPVAGKTGTTSSNNDIWFAGVTPYYSATIWIGNDYQIPLVATSDMATKYWSKIMKDIHSGYENKNFVTLKEAGLVQATVDRASGKLPSALSSRDPVGSIYTEWFIPGTVPKEIDDGHVELDVCVDDGKIATKYTPESKIVKKVFRLRVENDDGYSYGGISIEDDSYTLPRSFIKNGKINPELDVAKFSNLSKNPFSTTFNESNYKQFDVVSKLKNINLVDLGDGKYMILDNIIVTTRNNTNISINYGSRVDENGNINTANFGSVNINDIVSYQLENGEIRDLENSTSTLNNSNDINNTEYDKKDNSSINIDISNTNNEDDGKEIKEEDNPDGY